MKDFDVIVIGSGIGGLISAGLVASQGMRPLVIEAHKSPGGYVSSFKRQGFIFDSAVDCISGTGPDGIIGRVLSLLDAESDLDFLRVEPVRRSMFPDFNVDVHSDLKIYVEELISLFPAESGGIRNFFKAAGRVYEDVLAHIDIFSESRPGTLNISPDVIKLKNAAYEDMLREYVSDPRLIAVLSDRCPFIGLPPSEVSALQMIMLIMSYFRLGAYRPAGGFQRLSDALVKGIKKMGGRVILGNEVKRIIHDSRSCSGVVCKNGDEFTCRYLISNGDYINTFSSLLGGTYADMAEKLLARPGISTSFFIVYGSIKGEYKGQSSIGCFPSYDLSYFFRPESAFRDDNTIGITIASVEDSGRAPDGYGTIVMHEMIRGNEIFAHRGKCAELAVQRVERAMPDLKGRIEVIDTAVPATLQRYTKNHMGAAFGWKQVPGSFAFNGHGLTNLHIAGHWGEMGSGVLAAAYSGAKAAADILAKEGISVGC